MGRDKHHKRKEKGSEKSLAHAASSRAAAAGAAAVATYADGQPFDQVTYLEAKLILKPDRFTSSDSFREFGKIVQKTAKKFGVGFIEDPKARLRPEVREIVFGDTPDL